MIRSQRTWMLAIIGCLALTGIACKPESIQNLIGGKASEAPAPKKSADGKNFVPMTPPQTAKAVQPEPPPAPTIPKVVLTESLRESCLVGVDDLIPNLDLPDFEGNMHFIYGAFNQDASNVSVICLWHLGDTERSRMTAAQFWKDLLKDVEPYGTKVRVVGINVKDKPEFVRQFVEKNGLAVPMLLDANGEYYARIAKDRQMPRVYLVDSSNQILWFDVEYSRSSREDFTKALDVLFPNVKGSQKSQ